MPNCVKCGAPLVIKSKGAFNYVGCPTCVSAKSHKKKPAGGSAPAKKDDPPKKAAAAKKDDAPKKVSWIDDYV